ncbi:uncharacterized protein LOC110936330 isoform X1 [Helianthus annuus]|uniref:uncharacterized protein LOC110936330 isoform X1 n=1 Tax=Helianthus annuus TaxID=4232 RepID=UPI001652E33B|nr:uncharacterized protein LOC110936330 isoform X1 [Helianthus annuus]XP_035844957.1 uncharacterized protein LOC110936330 isoform X1 [Helianthus annuus]
MPFNCADTKPNHTNQTQRNRSLQKLLSSFNFTPSSPCSQQPHTSTPSFPLSSQSTPPPRSSLIPPATTIVLVVADISSSNTTTTTGGGTVVGGAGDRFKHERRTERERSGGERETPGEKRAAPPLTAATNAGDGKNGGGRRGAVAALRFVVQVHGTVGIEFESQVLGQSLVNSFGSAPVQSDGSDKLRVEWVWSTQSTSFDVLT